MKTGFLFCCRPSTSWPVVYKSQERRSLLSCLKVAQCSTSEIVDVPLYNACSLQIQVMTTGPLPALSKCKSGLPQITGTCPGWWKQSFRLQLWSLVCFQVRATSCIEVGLKVNTKVYLDVLKSVVIPWCNQVAGGRHWVWQPAHKSKETLAWLQKECYHFVPFSYCPLLPRPELTGLLRLVILRERHHHDLPQHQSLIAAIRRVFAELPPAPEEKACSQFRIRILSFRILSFHHEVWNLICSKV